MTFVASSIVVIGKIKSFGCSMYPLLHDRDIVYLQNNPSRQIHVDDIVVFRSNRRFITHRVVFKDSSFLIAKGDANDTIDGIMHKDRVLGLVNQVLRKGQMLDIGLLYMTQSAFYQKEVQEISDTFNRARLPFIILKGLPLHLYYEKTFPKRIYADCDVLIRKDVCENLLAHLRNRGYTRAKNSLVLNAPDEKSDELHYYKLYHGFPVVFDIHTNLVFLFANLPHLESLYPKKLSEQFLEKCLLRTRIISVHGNSYRILQQDLLILYLALHLFHHNMRGYHRYQFLDIVIRKELGKLGRKQRAHFWNEINMLIVQYKVSSFVYYVFYLLKIRYKTPIPQTFLANIRPSCLVLWVLEKTVTKKTMFDNQDRLTAGIQRFVLALVLSPQSIWRKFCLVVEPAVWLALIKILSLRLQFLFRSHTRNYLRNNRLNNRDGRVE